MHQLIYILSFHKLSKNIFINLKVEILLIERILWIAITNGVDRKPDANLTSFDGTLSVPDAFFGAERFQNYVYLIASNLPC